MPDWPKLVEGVQIVSTFPKICRECECGSDLHRKTMSRVESSRVEGQDWLFHGANVYRLPLNADDNFQIAGRQGNGQR